MTELQVAEHSVNCELCGEQNSSIIAIIRGRRIDRCNRCGLIYTNPRVLWDYNKDFGQLHEELRTYKRYYWPARYHSAIKVWNTLMRYRQTGWLLDVGCGFGLFLDEARQQGWNVMGVEKAGIKAAWAQENLGLTVWLGLENERLIERRFDVITLWDVIEHIPQPLPFLKRCCELLRPGGLILIKTPNAEGLLTRSPWWLKPYLYLYRHLVYPANPTEHMFHFSAETLQKFVRQAGFLVLDIDKWQDWKERVIVGRNLMILSLRHLLAYVAWRLKLPYEILMLLNHHQWDDNNPLDGPAYFSLP